MAVMCPLCPNGRRRFLARAGLTFCLGNVLDWTAALLCVGRYQWSLIRIALTAGEAHDNRLAGKLLSRLKSGTMLLAERGYDADWIRALAAERGVWANIPPRYNRNDPVCFSPHLYRARNLVERFFNKIKQRRRVATRYDKLAANYLAFIQLASIRLWLRVNESTP